jgi:hypothetical protein
MTSSVRNRMPGPPSIWRLATGNLTRDARVAAGLLTQVQLSKEVVTYTIATLGRGLSDWIGSVQG